MSGDFVFCVDFGEYMGYNKRQIRKKTEEFIMAKIDKNTIIGDILDIDETTAPFFFEMGMHCLGCPASRGETLEQACAVHGVDADTMVEKINAHLANK